MSKCTISGIMVCALVSWTALGAQGTKDEKAAEDGQKPRHEITVTANRIQTPLKETGSSVTIISREELERTGRTSVLEALEHVTGLHLLQNGPAGSQAAVQIRGSESQHVKLFLDGVALNEPITPGRTANLAHLMIENINRIEIVAGPQSTLYGSDAMGGVIHIITREETGRPRVRFSTQGGSYGTLASTGELSGGGQRLRYSLGFGQHRSGGFSATGSRDDGNLEKDGTRGLSLFGNMGFKLLNRFDLKFRIRAYDAETQIDNLGSEIADDPNHLEKNRGYVLSGEARAGFWGGRWSSRLLAAYHGIERSYDNPVDELHPLDSENSAYRSGLFEFDWQNDLFLRESNTLTFGIEHTGEWGESEYHSIGPWGPYDSVFPKNDARSTGLYLQDRIRWGGFFFATIGGRWDHHSQAGGGFTFRAAPSFMIESTGTRIKASLGTGFKAPSLYQLYAPGTLYGPIGNAELEPEKSTGWDAGIEQELFDNRLTIEAVYFSNRYENMIEFDSTRGYINTTEASTRGFECRLKGRPIEALLFTTSYTRTRARNDLTGENLLRRPEHKLSARLAWRMSPRVDISLDLLRVGKRADIHYVGWTSTGVTLDPYTLVNAVASYRVSGGLRLFARLDNLFNVDYEVIKGYATPGFSAYGGVKLDF